MMERTKQGTLDGREVELREVSAGVGIAANKTGDGFESMMVVLVHSAHWADSGERVFKDRAAIDNEWPMRMLPEIMALGALAGDLNLDTERHKAAIAAETNGAAAIPSH
jgi:hypothetical protein